MSFVVSARAAVVTASLALATTLAGCAPPRIANGNGDSAAVYAKTIPALAAHGFSCKIWKGHLVCDADKRDRPTLFVSYVPQGSRLLLVAFDRLDAPCADMLEALNRFNYVFDFAQASCRDDTTPMLFYVGSMVVPEDGLRPSDVGRYATFWSHSLMGALRASGLGKKRGTGDDEPRPKGAPPGREHDAPLDTTIRSL